jgi:hypothetical protein
MLLTTRSLLGPGGMPNQYGAMNRHSRIMGSLQLGVRTTVRTFNSPAILIEATGRVSLGEHSFHAHAQSTAVYEDMQNKYTRACRFPSGRGFLHKPSSSIDQRRAAALRPAVRRMFYSQARKVWRRRGPLINAQSNLPVLPRTPHRTFQAVFASQSASIVLGEFMHKSQRGKASSYAGVYEGARPVVTFSGGCKPICRPYCDSSIVRHVRGDCA